MTPTNTHLPTWIRTGLAPAGSDSLVRKALSLHAVNTICEHARCPNRKECYSAGTATFLILGPNCTRHCGFCAVSHGKPLEPDPDETVRIIATVQEMHLEYAVITSVTRDDLADGGANQFISLIDGLHTVGVQVEVLIPDLMGNWDALEAIAKASPEVLAHDIQTIPRLYPIARPNADYQRSLELLQRVRIMFPKQLTKAALLVGLGETEKELEETLTDLANCGVNMVVIGQYIQPGREQLPVARWWTPRELDELAQFGKKLGIIMHATPLARSSHRARQLSSITSDSVKE